MQLAGIGLIAVALLVGGALVYIEKSVPKPVPHDTATLCPISGPKSIKVILIDVTDTLPEAAKKDVTARLKKYGGEIDVDGLLELRALDPNTLGGRILFRKCNPGDGSGLSEWTRNPRQEREKWDNDFNGPLQKIIEQSLVASDASVSPLLRTLQHIALERFSGSQLKDVPKSLVVLSDLIEHTAAYSQYSGDLSYERFRRTDLYKDVRTDLGKASVTFLYIQRKLKKPLPIGHMDFWRKWVDDNNGAYQSIDKIQGLG